MKKLFYIIAVLFTFAGVLASCQKETEEVILLPEVVSSEAFSAQVDNSFILTNEQVVALYKEQSSKGLSSLTKEQVNDVLMRLSLKSASNIPDMVINKPLGSKQNIVINNQLVTFFGYMQIDQYGEKVHEYTYSLTYDIKDGKVDTTSFWFDFEMGCPQAKDGYLSKNVNPSNLSCFGVDEKNNIFYFNLDNYYREGSISIRPYEGIKWYVQGYDQISKQEFVTSLVDYYNDSNIFSILVDIKSSNILSVVEVEKTLLDGANSIQINGFDDAGNEVSIGYKVPYSPQLSDKLSFNTTFKVTDVYICGKYGCTHYKAIVSSVSVVGSNTVWYKLKQE